MAVTFGLPWWDGWMYRIVTGVTSYVTYRVVTLYVDDLTPRTIYATYIIYIISCHLKVWGWGSFFKVVVTLNHVGGSFNLNHRDVWIIPSFRMWGYVLHVEARFMCHHELWLISVSHPFSSLSSALLDEDITRKLLSSYSFLSLYLLSSGWFVIVVCNSYFIHGSVV